eukprot:COSAG01_NODE_63565_length_279_cov_1.144444_1_plen_22_part_10
MTEVVFQPDGQGVHVRLPSVFT